VEEEAPKKEDFHRRRDGQRKEEEAHHKRRVGREIQATEWKRKNHKARKPVFTLWAKQKI
jgi:hypothetical protein